MVSPYPTIQLMGRSPLPGQSLSLPFAPCSPPQKAPSGISRRFQRLSPSPGQVNHVLRTRSPLSVHPKVNFPFDLHVLGTPPTFILSQDQTRRLYPTSVHIRIFCGPGYQAPSRSHRLPRLSRCPVVNLRPAASRRVAARSIQLPRRNRTLHPQPGPVKSSAREKPPPSGHRHSVTQSRRPNALRGTAAFSDDSGPVARLHKNASPGARRTQWSNRRATGTICSRGCLFRRR